MISFVGAHWLWDIPVLANDVTIRAADWRDTENPIEHTLCDQRIVSVTRLLDNEGDLDLWITCI